MEKQPKTPPYTQNRELSWLRFNQRVLEEGADPQVPLLERLKFVSIFTSNLDEFFMIRVGSLFDIAQMDADHLDNKSGWTATQQLDQIYKAVGPLYHQRNETYTAIKKEMTSKGIHALDYKDLRTSEAKYVREYYKSNIRPILAPQIVDPHHPFPHIANKEVYIVALLKRKGETVLGLMPIPSILPPILRLPGEDFRYIRMEYILLNFAQDMFGKYEIIEKNCMCITRNADIHPDDEAYVVSMDFRTLMKKALNKRRRLAVVRLEVNYPMSDAFSKMLCEKFEITQTQIFVSSIALKLNYAFDLIAMLSDEQRKSLTFPTHTPTPTPEIVPGKRIISQIRQKDLLTFYPYQSMDTFLQMIREAANDPAVISIKITIYRLAKKAKLVDYLCAAAENGKEVTVLLELRARFDEQNNIDWSERLEDAGCKIIYGFDVYKVHSKVCLITCKDKNGIYYITQVGTGNYNEKTALLYTDLSLTTANPEIGRDAVEFFKNMSIANPDGRYKRLLVAPNHLKDVILDLIDAEIEKGVHGSIFLKMNSLTDIDFINKLTEASKAGVEIKIIVRGICCVLPHIPGQTDNILITSIVGRFLEHSRVYCFGSGDEQSIYIASADLMTRNTERRIEVACPILDPAIKRDIIEMMETHWSDNVKARVICADGSYSKKIDNRQPFNSQEYFIRHYETLTPPQKAKSSMLVKIRRLFGSGS